MLEPRGRQRFPPRHSSVGLQTEALQRLEPRGRQRLPPRHSCVGLQTDAPQMLEPRARQRLPPRHSWVGLQTDAPQMLEPRGKQRLPPRHSWLELQTDAPQRAWAWTPNEKDRHNNRAARWQVRVFMKGLLGVSEKNTSTDSIFPVCWQVNLGASIRNCAYI